MFLIVMLVSQFSYIIGTFIGPRTDNDISKGFVGELKLYLDIQISLFSQNFLQYNQEQ